MKLLIEEAKADMILDIKRAIHSAEQYAQVTEDNLQYVERGLSFAKAFLKGIEK